jgi:hypothetical protein
MNMQNKLRQPLEIWHDSIKDWRRWFVKLLPLSIIMSIAFALINGVFPIMAVMTLHRVYDVIGLASLCVFLSIFSLFIGVAIGITYQKNASLKQACILSCKKIIPVFLIYAMGALIFISVYQLINVQYLMFSIGTIIKTKNISDFWGFYIGVVTFAFGSIFLMPSALLMPLRVFIDHDTAVLTFVNSIKLVWANWWRTFIILLPAALFYYGCLATWRFPVFIVLPVIFFPLIVSLLVNQYNDLKLRKQQNPKQAVTFALFGEWFVYTLLFVLIFWFCMTNLQSILIVILNLFGAHNFHYVLDILHFMFAIIILFAPALSLVMILKSRRYSLNIKNKNVFILRSFILLFFVFMYFVNNVLPFIFSRAYSYQFQHQQKIYLNWYHHADILSKIFQSVHLVAAPISFLALGALFLRIKAARWVLLFSVVISVIFHWLTGIFAVLSPTDLFFAVISLGLLCLIIVLTFKLPKLFDQK